MIVTVIVAIRYCIYRTRVPAVWIGRVAHVTLIFVIGVQVSYELNQQEISDLILHTDVSERCRLIGPHGIEKRIHKSTHINTLANLTNKKALTRVDSV